MEITIANLQHNQVEAVRDAAGLLVAELGLPNWPSGYNNLEEALEEVNDCLQPGRILRAARTSDGSIAGWTGGRPSYGGRVWELHPLVVRRDLQRRGIGRRLVADLEIQVVQRGALTLWLGTDDEDFRTTLSGVNLYEALPGVLAGASGVSGHPIEFYRKLGFTVVGVLPDANGRGKPDIFMAKRVGV